jgi:parallel beta-helix repeat protein
VAGNVITGTAACGISVSDGYTHRSRRVLIQGNVIDRAGYTPDPTAGVPGHAIYVLRSDDTTITDNDVRGSRAGGIALTRARRARLLANSVLDNGAAGLRLDDAENVTAIDNTVLGNGSAAEPYGAVIISTDSTMRSRDVLLLRNRIGNAPGGGPQRYGVYLVGAGTEAITIESNDLRGNNDGPRGGLAGRGTRYGDNVER